MNSLTTKSSLGTNWNKMREELEKKAPGLRYWHPHEVGQILMGKLIKINFIDCKYGPTKVAVIKDVEQGDLVEVWLNRAMLRDEWEKCDPQIGDQVGIIFLGEGRGKKYAYHKYKICVYAKESKPATSPA